MGSGGRRGAHRRCSRCSRRSRRAGSSPIERAPPQWTRRDCGSIHLKGSWKAFRCHRRRKFARGFPLRGEARGGGGLCRLTKNPIKIHSPSHPGEILREPYLKPMNVTITEGAEALGVMRKAREGGVGFRRLPSSRRRFYDSVVRSNRLTRALHLAHSLGY
jgi:hypothetical protein